MRRSTEEPCCSKMASRQTDVSLDVEEQKQQQPGGKSLGGGERDQHGRSEEDGKMAYTYRDGAEE